MSANIVWDKIQHSMVSWGQEETPSSIPFDHLKGKPKDWKGFARFMDNRKMEKNYKFKFF
jgi:hypothetical protein